MLIPAYQPGAELESVVSAVLRLDVEGVLSAIVVVDDGSDAACGAVFQRVAALPGVTLLRHAVNLGKGAALKTGFNHCLVTWPESCGVVTADADGQHAPADILKVARRLMEHPNALVLGAREFPAQIPLRSRFGNILTRLVFLVFTGKLLRDTQTGLRGWPAAQCRDSLRVPIQGYDFELETLVRGRGGAIEEVGIETIYLDGNRASHFNPLRDSFRIYFVFLRYCGSALLAAGVDTLVFSAVYARFGELALSQAAGRIVAMCVAFLVLRSVVFRSDVPPWITFARYAALVAFSGWVSFGLIELLRDHAHLPVLGAKLLAEGLLFLGNFAIQRQFIFTKR
ncbi:MAG TPA: bifunctional glycosyltransferase family 2/GtrA family protein [Paludibaculum sp.]